jgi:hypothetical protein
MKYGKEVIYGYYIFGELGRVAESDYHHLYAPTVEYRNLIGIAFGYKRDSQIYDYYLCDGRYDE